MAQWTGVGSEKNLNLQGAAKVSGCRSALALFLSGDKDGRKADRITPADP